MTYKPQTKKVGKPVGTRSIPTLHAEILRVLKEDKEQNGDGLTASGISKALHTDRPFRLYLGGSCRAEESLHPAHCRNHPVPAPRNKKKL